MEIKNLRTSTGAIRAYEKVAAGAKPAAKPKSENVDKIDFDFTGSLGAAKADAVSCAEAEANTARIERLAADYAGDSCPTSAAETAAAIIGS